MYDILIKGGRIADGTGERDAYVADLAVLDGKIVKIAPQITEPAEEVIDASGLVVAPGFIDAHAHSDTVFLRDGSGAAKLFQGVPPKSPASVAPAPSPPCPSA